MSDDGKNGNAPQLPARAQTGLYIRAKKGLKLRDQKRARLVREKRVEMDWLEESDIPALKAWCEFEILCSEVYAWLRVGNVVNAQGDGKRLLHDYRQMRLAQATIANSLGMTPASRMAIKATGTRTAFDLPGAMAAAAEDAETVETGGKEVKADE